jgi:hypothetical protein
MSDWSKEAQQAVDALRDDPATEADQARIEAALMAQVGLTVTDAPTPAGGPGVVSAGQAVLTGKSLFVILGGTAVVGAALAWSVFQPRPSSSASPPRSETPPALAATIVPTTEVDAGLVEAKAELPVVKTVAAPSRPRSPPPPPAPLERAPEPVALPEPASAEPPSSSPPAVPTLADELAVLERARQSLTRGEFTEALERTREHRERFPNGTLHLEREALELRALCALGRAAEAAGGCPP